MADLRPEDRGGEDGDRRGSDRGQLILVTAVALSVAIVALVLLLNGAIYSENLATRDSSADGPAALEFESAAVEGIGGIVDRENYAEYDDRGDLEENVTAGTARFEQLLIRQYIEKGVGGRIGNESLHEGTLVRQTNSSRAFTNESGTRSDWTIATGVPDVRNHAVTVDRSNLTQTDESNAESDAFHVVLNDTNDDEWHAYVYENSSDVAVAVKNGSESGATEVCSVDADDATVDFTAGTLDGEPCDGLVWAKGLSGPYDVEYANGDEAKGTYGLTLNGTSIETSNLDDGPSDSPYHVPAVYSVTADLHYETPELRYATEIRVAPGEPDA